MSLKLDEKQAKEFIENSKQIRIRLSLENLRFLLKLAGEHDTTITQVFNRIIENFKDAGGNLR